jgi:hypothetical protein
MAKSNIKSEAKSKPPSQNEKSSQDSDSSSDVGFIKMLAAEFFAPILGIVKLWFEKVSSKRTDYLSDFKNYCPLGFYFCIFLDIFLRIIFLLTLIVWFWSNQRLYELFK